jgi:hypothetical protein
MADLIMKISKMKYERPSAEQQKYLQTRQFLQFQKKDRNGKLSPVGISSFTNEKRI